MAIEYENSDKFKALIGITEDYTEWFSRIALLVAYQEDEMIPDNLATPDSFTNWLSDAKGGATIDTNVLTHILKIETTLEDLGKNILETLQSGMKPSYLDFLQLKNLHSSFLMSVRRLERDSALEMGGVDDLTGMRPLHSLKKDLDKEIGRMERNNSQFTLALIRVDNFESYPDAGAVLKVTTKNIKEYLRPFDDAYYLEDGFFLLTLKYADIAGGEAVILRAQNSLHSDDENVHNITVSGALSEPIVGDELFKILDEMKSDLNNNVQEKNVILKFLDISPLEKFVMSKG